jgi:nitrogen fixation NifU-like protein
MMEIFLRMEEGAIVQCTFLTDGCGTTIACGSIVTELVLGKTVKEVKAVTQAFVLKTCGGLPTEDEHCALLASNTLMEAIALYEDSKK